MGEEQSKKYPFKFLDPYNKDDYAIFFGRSREIEDLYKRTFQSNLILVYGKSGTGKTSLVQCGLASKFSDDDWFPLLIRRGSDINAAFFATIEENVRTPLQPGMTPYEMLQSLFLDFFKPIYLIFDQFEELFTMESEESERLAFIRDLASIIDRKIPIKVLLVMREEYLANLSDFERAIPQIMENRIRIEFMGRANAKEVINGSCAQAIPPINIEKDVDDHVVDIVTRNKGPVELTYLQVFLDQLYWAADEKSDGSRTFTLALVDNAGTIENILEEFVDMQISEFIKLHKDKTLPVNFLKAFTTRQGTKAPLTREALYNKLPLPKRHLENCFEFFVDKRILRPMENEMYELSHDSLAKSIASKKVQTYQLPTMRAQKSNMSDPIVGFDHYTRAHAKTFFGREHEVQTIFDRVMNDPLSRITILYGKLGVGKTSLLLAGLCPNVEQLKKTRYLRITRHMVLNDVRPLLKDEDGFRKSILFAPLQEKEHPKILIWDQMEELFLYITEREELQLLFDFIAAIHDALDETQFVWSIREEYFANLTDLETHIPAFMDKRKRLTNLTHAQGRTIVDNILKMHKLEFDTGTLELFLSKLQSEDGRIDPTHLQMYLKRIAREMETVE